MLTQKWHLGSLVMKWSPFQNLDTSIVHRTFQESIKAVMSGRKIVHGKDDKINSNCWTQHY